VRGVGLHRKHERHTLIATVTKQVVTLHHAGVPDADELPVLLARSDNALR
jgi:hypothetical protein